jgi:glycosidase
VFPERFRNGNAANDPYAWDRTVVPWDRPLDAVTLEEVEMAWNRRVVEPRFFSADPDRWWGAAGQVIFEKRYGGDLQGVVERLDHIAGLGATGLYLCPVFEARSLHKYEASDHRHVDPTLGHPASPGPVDRSREDPLDETTWGWEPADRYLVEVLLPEARKRGLRVILDGVWNHVGRDHFAFRDVLEHGRRSAYADWFKVEFDADGRVVSYDAWDRPNGALPEFRQTPEGDLAPGPKAHIYAVTRRWMDPNGDGDPSDGIDGWRLDVAPEIGRRFWSDWRGLVRSINPEAVLIGEIWTDAALWFNGVAFDAQMNYPLAYPIAD